MDRFSHTFASAARWPNAETVDDWEQGIPLSYVQDLCAYWAEKYDWRAREEALNRFPQWKLKIEGGAKSNSIAFLANAAGPFPIRIPMFTRILSDSYSVAPNQLFCGSNRSKTQQTVVGNVYSLLSPTS